VLEQVQDDLPGWTRKFRRDDLGIASESEATMTQTIEERARERLTNILMIAEAEMGCAMSVLSTAKIKLEFEQVVTQVQAEARLEEENSFRLNIGLATKCNLELQAVILKLIDERIATLKQAAHPAQKETK
jgi:hypothetical protein